MACSGMKPGTPSCTDVGMREKSFSEAPEILSTCVQFSLLREVLLGYRLDSFDLICLCKFSRKC